MQQSLNDVWATVWVFLPQLGAATAILLGGWIVARLIGAAVAGTLKRTELDNQLAEWMGAARRTGSRSSEPLGARPSTWSCSSSWLRSSRCWASR